MDVLPPGWQDFSAGALVSAFVFAILFGWLIPRRWHERAMADKDKTIEWQRQALDSSLNATTNLAGPAKTAAHALRSIAREADPSKGGDE